MRRLKEVSSAVPAKRYGRVRKNVAIAFAAFLIGVLVAVWMLHANAWTSLIALGLVIGIGALVSGWWVRREKADLLSDRSPLTQEEIFIEFYASSQIPKVVLVKLWQEVATTLGYDPSLIRPTDRFGVELREFQFTDGEVDQLSAIAQARIKQGGLHIDLTQIATVDDYIRAFAPHVSVPQ